VPTHVWFEQATGVAHVPVALHDCCAVVLVHSTWLGAQTPWQDAVPPVTRQVLLVQVAGEPKAPLVLQVETPLLVHMVAPGVQFPVHMAEVELVATHAWLVQGTAAPQLPAVQVCSAALPEHCVEPAAHVPVQTPPEQVAAPHGTADPQVPVPLHVSTPLPLQRTDPGTQLPVHDPPTQAELVQITGAPQAPLALHVATPLTEPPSDPTAHSVELGEHTPLHVAVPTGPTQAWLVQAAAVPQVPFAVHVCSAALPEHCVWPGAHTPPHEALPPDAIHVVLLHVEGVPQVPVALQVATPLTEPPSDPTAHSVEPGAHTPVQAAEPTGPTQAWFGHVAGAFQLPPELQIWMAELPEHCVSPGLHVPWHDAVPFVTPQVELVQATGVPQLPFASHVETPDEEPDPEHSVVPGTHDPVHAPPTHAELEHAAAALQVPVELQVSTPLPTHWVVVGVQVPMQAPLTHAWFEQAVALAHWPFDPHVWTPLPEHRVAPGTHTPAHAPFTHAYVHALAAPQLPLDEQVSTPAAPPSGPVEHRVVFGAQTPWHDADVELAVTQACVPQSTGLPNWPPTHDCRALPEHWVLPVEHEPEHCPAVHAPLEQATVAPHAPEGSHVWVPVPAAEHCTAPGAHTP
jgi:hypothetical protein